MLAILANWVVKPPTCLVPPAQSFVCFGLQGGSTEDSKFFVVASSGISLNLDKKAHTKDTLTYINYDDNEDVWYPCDAFGDHCYWVIMTTMVVLLTVLRVKLMIDKIDWDEKEPVHRLQPDDIWRTVVQWLHLLRFFFFKAATNSGWRRPYNCGFEALTKDHVPPGYTVRQFFGEVLRFPRPMNTALQIVKAISKWCNAH